MKHTTLLVANRGEIACRIILSAKRLGLRCIAVYSEADGSARHVRLADAAIPIGPSPAAQSYLDIATLVDAARQSGATLVHPGYGFLSESSTFARACADSGIVFVGPSPHAMDLMADKEMARQVARDAGVPVLPGTGKLDPAAGDGLMAQARRIGFPLLVKAAAGGGGIGIKLVVKEEELLPAATATSSMASKAFGDGAIYLERYIQRARHVEVQLFGFGREGAISISDRDCSIQRRRQKVLEEAPAPGVAEAARKGMADTAVALARACNYEGAGTVEFLYDDDDSCFYFMEMNTRLQVEHPVTETVTGIDLVEMQLRYAMGTLSPETSTRDIAVQGHSIEARICAEDPSRSFRPSPGRITKLDTPSLEGVRVDTGFESGDSVSPYYDNLVLKLITRGATRSEAIALMADALQATTIEGIRTNLPLLRAMLQDPGYRAGALTTTYLEDNLAALLENTAAAL